MQTCALTIEKFLDHAAKWFPDREVVTAGADGLSHRLFYAPILERSRRLSGAFAAFGLAKGDRIGTLGWNTGHHLETY